MHHKLSITLPGRRARRFPNSRQETDKGAPAPLEAGLNQRLAAVRPISGNLPPAAPTGVWLIVLLGLILALGSSLATAGSEQDVTSGSLRLRTLHGEWLHHAPLVDTSVQLRVTGTIARASVVQSFTNPTGDWLEGVYLFPLPDDAAVDRLRMRVGDRVTEGEVQEKRQARRSYEQAKASGRQASLLTQFRPNVFTASVANIPPYGEIEIEIAYQHILIPDQGLFSLRFPLVVAPRYRPAAAAAGCRDGDAGRYCRGHPDEAFAADTVLSAPLHNPVTIKVDLNAGIPLDRVQSVHHRVDILPLEPGRFQVELADGPVPADRDFDLTWQPAAADTPGLAVFGEERADGHYQLLMLLPPATESTQLPGGRELILVVDKSGSMHGESMAQAKAALQLALRRLRPADRFNLISFDNRPDRLFPRARAAEPGNIRLALDYVDDLEADGGTEMLPAMRLALDAASQSDRLRQVVFLTDGAVGNEQALFRAVVDRLGDSRLFTVGIGAAPNSYFMTRAAEFGRGSFTFIGRVDDVQEKMARLFRKLEHPVLTDVRVDWQGGDVEQWPAQVPDLYSGEPVLLALRSDQPLTQVSVGGRLGQQSWSRQLRLQQSAGGESGIHLLWARQKLRQLMGEMIRGGDPELLRREIVELALRHRLVSKFTSLVAVDKTPVRPPDEQLVSRRVPRNLPAGWNAQKVFGQLPQTATPALLHFLIGIGALAGLGVTGWRRKRAARPD